MVNKKIMVNNYGKKIIYIKKIKKKKIKFYI